MYIDDKWTPVQGEELAGFLDQIDPVGGKYKVNPETTIVEWRMLPFYDQVALIRVKDPAWTPRNLFIYYLTDQGNLYWLNGTSPPIHEINAKAPIKITDENVLEYLNFFCFFVRGEEGPFLIAESMDDPYMPKDLDDRTRSVIEGTIRPASYEGKNEQGYWLCDAVVYYSNALFIANFAVQPGGMIEMLDDEPIAADLPVKVDAPVS
ncbi:MAG: hypothetical protein H6853_01125 [Rhodospirillales bacterium]|nr:hypothetical protein [Alphaproteobacteria bacterium]USO03915.1 MAG: hypothetical protein H6853_01125 [Rhodospirillales bacterium]